MKKITYLELLEMIKERKQPRRVVCDDILWLWNGHSFIKRGEDDSRIYLSNAIFEDLDDDKAIVKCIEVIDG